MQTILHGTVAKQAKMIGAKLKLQRKEDDDELEDEEDADPADERWGANKKRYYDADTAELEVRMRAPCMG